MKKSTGELLDTMKKKSSFSSYAASISESFIEENTPHIALNALLKEKHLKKSDIIKASGLNRTYAYDIISGRKTPTRDKILMLCLAMQLSMDETQRLLYISGYPQLYAKVKRESAILFALEKHLSVMETNHLLYEMEDEVLK